MTRCYTHTDYSKGELTKTKKTWKPTTAGILAIIIGAFCGLLFGTIFLLYEEQDFYSGMALAFVIIAIIGGIYALRRKVFGLAATGSYSVLVCGTMFSSALIAGDAPFLTVGHYVMLAICIVLGILVIVFTHLGKGEFG